MEELKWLFDEQGRMRADLPPVLYPEGPTIFHPPQSFMDDIEIVPTYNGWQIIPKRFPRAPGHTTPYGLMFRREF